MGTQRLDFAEFYQTSVDGCLRAVLVTVSPAPGHMVARTHVEHDLVYASPRCTG